MKLSELKPPVTIEYTRHREYRGSLTARERIVAKSGRNLQTDSGNWLWWPTVNYYNDVRIVEEESPQQPTTML